MQSFGILDETKAQQELGYQGSFTNLDIAIDDFIHEVIASPGRFKKPELY